MDLRTLEVGARLQLKNGNTVVVTARAQSPNSVSIKVVDAPAEPDLEGARGIVSIDSIYGAYTNNELTRF